MLKRDAPAATIAGVDQHVARRLQHLQARLVLSRSQVRGPEQQAHRGGGVATGERATAGRAEMLGRPRGERSSVVRHRPKLLTQPERLLEVVAEDLVVLGHAVAGARLEPVGVALMQVGPKPLRDGLVGRIADEDVAEAVGGLVRELGRSGADELLLQERV